MRNATRQKYNAYTAQIGKLNAVEDPSRSFTVAPAVAQTLRGKIQQSSAFLTSINIIPVTATSTAHDHRKSPPDELHDQF
ncbi:P2 family phage major capsid protein [Sphingomonas sp. BK481]|uniref:P2 family phage major capsid protein n=1 Tax=Sphingomonas sp. BK481 TaxID=2586981 RepID=UPI001618C129|nr:P2 family phage major capsid protein [Sphingomonas sp. BK481]MBB3586888.1 hypothetical protein [Sphingomonas sp. BK481]